MDQCWTVKTGFSWFVILHLHPSEVMKHMQVFKLYCTCSCSLKHPKKTAPMIHTIYYSTFHKLVLLILSPRKVVPQFGIAKWFVLISLTMSNCWGLLGDMDICSILQGFSQGTNSAIRRTFRTPWARTNWSTPWASTLCAAGSGSFRPPAPYQETHTSSGRFFCDQ